MLCDDSDVYLREISSLHLNVSRLSVWFSCCYFLFTSKEILIHVTCVTNSGSDYCLCYDDLCFALL